MSKHLLRDERGVAMLLELVLVAAVLTLVGLALYQSNHRGSLAKVGTPPKLSAAQTADSAVKAVEQSADDEISASAAAETTADELTAIDTSVTDLGGSSDASNF